MRIEEANMQQANVGGEDHLIRDIYDGIRIQGIFMAALIWAGASGSNLKGECNVLCPAIQILAVTGAALLIYQVYRSRA